MQRHLNIIDKDGEMQRQSLNQLIALAHSRRCSVAAVLGKQGVGKSTLLNAGVGNNS